MPLKALSTDFLDAVGLTSRMSLRYIWKDSLCIIQDSPEDWANEAVQMSAIFAHAEVAISALRSTSGDSGFLLPRTSRTVAIPYRTTISDPGSSKEVLGFRLTSGRAEISNSPLNKRG